MSERSEYPANVPCWVENMQSDVERANAFYAAVMGWAFDGPGPMPDGGSYYVAKLGDADVAGIGSKQSAMPSAWGAYTAVDNVDATAAVIARAGGTLLGEPFDAPPAGRGAIFADPTGAVSGIWQAETRQGAGRVNEPGAWSMSVLRTTDTSAAAEFYNTVFGWETMEFEMGGAKMYPFRLPGYVGGTDEQPVPRDVVATMMAIEPGTPEASNWGLDFWVADVDRVVATAKELGGSILMPVTEIGPFKRAIIADPEGATFFASQL